MAEPMTLSIVPNKFTQPDFTVFYTAPDGRKLASRSDFQGYCRPAGNALVLVGRISAARRAISPYKSHLGLA